MIPDSEKSTTDNNEPLCPLSGDTVRAQNVLSVHHAYRDPLDDKIRLITFT